MFWVGLIEIEVVRAGRFLGLELIIPGWLIAPEQNVTLPLAPRLGSMPL